MYGYIVSRPLTLAGGGQHKQLHPAGNFNRPAIDEVHIPAQRELDLLRAALQKTFPQEPLKKLMRILAPKSFSQVPGLPVTLGVRAFADPDEKAATGCLIRQLQALKTAAPQRGHYRLLLVNAFGLNLGDNLIGLTAFRRVLDTLRAELPAVSVDVLLGWHNNDRLSRLFRDVDGIGTILTQGPTLAELTRYQALFDTGQLIILPRYGKMPTVDWYLWWMGVDPETVPAEAKRNAVGIPDDAKEQVARQLPPADGPRILINPKATVALRSLSEQTTRRLVEHVLAAWPQAQVILMQPLAVEHPRLFNLSGAVSTVDLLAALVAQVDGLVGVDTYTQHLADATATPAVTLYPSVAPGLYPYYPLGASVLLPDAQKLPAWGKMKVSPEVWAGIAEAYEAAWQKLAPDTVLGALRRVMNRKADEPSMFKTRLLPARTAAPAARTRLLTAGKTTLEVPLRQHDDPMAKILNRTIANISKQVLCPGDTVAVLGAGAGEAALGLARAVGRHGRLVAFEPRRELHQVLCANLAAAGICHADTHAVMPDGDGFAVRKINRLRIADDHRPLDLANCAEPEPVACWPFDALGLKACRLVVVCSPMPLLSALQGARATLERLRPVVLSGVLRLQDAAAMEQFFAKLRYRVKTLELGDARNLVQTPQFGLVVAEPEPLRRKVV
jgi:hypothetical protein